MTLCDIGNTTFSFLYKNKKFKIDVNSKSNKLPTIKNTIYFVSVNKKATKEFIKKYPQAINIKKLINFKTKYKGMGIDRQVACYGVKNAIVVDIGSAITVDIMKNGNHKGGFILPGIKKLIGFYPQISPKLHFSFKGNSLNYFENKVNLDKIPLCTDDAIGYAILKSVIEPIKNLEEKYNLPIYFTGEDTKYIIKHFLTENSKHKNIKYKKNLIFNNMRKIIKQGNNK